MKSNKCHTSRRSRPSTIALATWAAVAILSAIGSLAKAGNWSQEHPHATSEAECTTIDLRSYFGPARDQGNIGWCYANVTADLLTFFYRNDLKGERVSSGYTALAFNHDTFKSSLEEGGTVDKAIRAAAEEGLCPESLEKEVMSSGPKMQIKQKLDAFMKFKRLYDGGQTDPVQRAAFAKQAQAYRETNSTLFDLKSGEIANLLATSTQKNFPLEFARLLCRGHEITATPPHPHMTSVSKEAIMKFNVKLSPYIHSELEKNQPIAIGYAAQFLSQKEVPNWRFSWHRLVNEKEDLVSRHASMIVGRRWNGSTKRCEFILRNSWGGGCGYGNPLYRNTKKCEAGHLFVGEEFLETQVYRVSYFADSAIGRFNDKIGDQISHVGNTIMGN